MDCEKVRDRFSSLWEKELTPPDGKMVREHLSSCRECQKEFERFEKTMEWLRSVGEVEVPNGFLPELQKKMGERKGKAIVAGKTRAVANCIGKGHDVPRVMKFELVQRPPHERRAAPSTF